ncbi:Rna recognition motif-containing protein, partial [Cardiosporidium cionae]
MYSQIGRTKKLKESAEEKQREEEETARVYADFVKSFAGSDDSGPKTFIRGGVIETGDDGIAKSTTIVEKSKIYKPQKRGLWLPPPSESLTSKPKTTSSKAESKKEIDSFLEEIKKKQHFKEERRNLQKAATEASTEEDKERISKQLEDLENATKGRGSIPGVVEAEQTTNLYLGNLSTDVTEEFLCQQFGKFGAITSVKIMYPRTEEEKSRGRNCGFVSFGVRDQAEAAKNTLDGADFYGMIVRIGWGKAVPKAGSSQPPLPAIPAVIQEVLEIPSSIPTKVVEVPVPTNRRVKMTIDILSKYVADEGHPLEQLIMEKELKNSKFSFLFKSGSPENIYYRWRVFAYTQGDTLKSWRLEAFQIYNGGSMWKPPGEEYFQEPVAINSNFSDTPPEGLTAAAAGSYPKHKELVRANQSGGQSLSRDDRNLLLHHLENLSKQRAFICDAMTFCVDHSDSSMEIAQCITDSLLSFDVLVDKLIARLYLISDILYNSSSLRPSAWSYRNAFEKCLPDIFLYFSEVRTKITRKLILQQFKDVVMKILRIWEDWAVYSIEFFKGLEASFLYEENILSFSFLQDEFVTIDEELDGEPLESDISDKLAEFSPSLRPMVQEWLSMETSQLERICQQRGLSIKHKDNKLLLLKRLANYETYWKSKE